MEFTWQDIDSLISLNEVFNFECHRPTYRSKEYCEELLKRFNKVKNKMKKKCLWGSKHDCRLCAAECEVREVEFDFKQAIENATISQPRKKDEIDEWLESECNIHLESCSSIEELRYITAREVAEKLLAKLNKPLKV